MTNEPNNISNQGQVVGFSDLPGDASFHAFLWTEDKGMQDLGTLPGDVFSGGDGNNDKGQVVGFSCNADFSICRAFLWQNGTMTDLNTLIPASPLSLFEAFGINSRGEITGVAIDQTTDVGVATAVTDAPGTEALADCRSHPLDNHSHVGNAEASAKGSPRCLTRSSTMLMPSGSRTYS